MTGPDPVAVLAELVAERIHARGPDVPRVALTRQEAAAALGVSVDHFERHVLPGLRVIRSGRLVLIPSPSSTGGRKTRRRTRCTNTAGRRLP